MRTLGADLATEAAATSICWIDWTRGTCAVASRMRDDPLVEAMRSADRVGIDAPFGWPDAFRAAIDAWAQRGEWIAGAERAPLRLRLTDELAVQPGARPMSVSANLLGATAMRCAHLLQRLGGPLDRVHGHAVEVYPAGSLAAWGYTDARRYKERGAHELRRRIAQRLEHDAGIDLGASVLDACTRSDHNLDALICSLTTRAVHLGDVRDVPDDDRIAREGWIHLPLPGSLARLAGD